MIFLFLFIAGTKIPQALDAEQWKYLESYVLQAQFTAIKNGNFQIAKKKLRLFPKKSLSVGNSLRKHALRVNFAYGIKTGSERRVFTLMKKQKKRVAR